MKQYFVSFKQLMKKQERILTIDGEYINLVAVEGKNFFDIGMSRSTNSFHASTIQSCRQTGSSNMFKHNIPGKVYDLEASTAAEAFEICTRIMNIQRMTKKAVI